MGSVNFAGGTIGPGDPTFVIAEAGSNHNGDLGMAKDLIDVAADAGADAVKFQTFRTEKHYVEDTGPAEYLDDDRSIYEIVSELEMPRDWIPKLDEYAASRDLCFLSTPSDPDSADALAGHVPLYKVESFNLSNYPFLKHLAATGKPLVLSTGAHTFEEVVDAVGKLDELGVESYVLLHCVSAYPTPLDEINVRFVERLDEAFDCPVGLSDHTLDPTTAPAAAVALGASVVEKHFTLDNDLEGPDHEFALEPDEFDTMVTAIRRTEQALGDGRRELAEQERELAEMVRRFVQATRDIEPGETITEENTALLSPGHQTSGVKPEEYEEILGRTAVHRIEKSDGVTWDDVE